MSKLIDEIKYDLNFIQSHTLQPKWFKFLKVFLLLGFLGLCVFLFGWWRMVIFLICFTGLMAVVHFVYRARTKRFSQSWLDFIVYEEDGEKKYKRIGKYYYGAILVNAILAFIISQVWPSAA
jgi:ABC-type multidrug transport system fused ATPase/permease subunit